jgi:hypothetical protein
MGVDAARANGKLGICTAKRDGSNLLYEAVVVINPVVFEGYHAGPLPVVVHELGHALGLEHRENDVSVMRPMLGGEKFCITQADIDSYAKEHGGKPETMRPTCVDWEDT